MNHEFAQGLTSEWSSMVDELYRDFPAGGAEGILPPHFVRATFPKIGGCLVNLSYEDCNCWMSLLPGGDRLKQDWTLRVNRPIDVDDEIKSQIDKRLPEWIAVSNLGENVFVFDVVAKRQEEFREKILQQLGDGIRISHPSSFQAKAAENLHRQVWNVKDLAFLYPYDLYHPESGLATQLVASQENKVIGFLFGFYGKGKQGKWIESQLLAVDSDYRQTGIAKKLKLIQRDHALREGIDLVHWTVDPLQAGNAFFNFNKLGAVAAQFYPDYYVFRNDLNRITPSRIGMSWMLNSDHVRECVVGESTDWNFASLIHDSGVEIILPQDLMPEGQHQDDFAWTPRGKRVLVEIPADWNEIQRANIDMAIAWRTASDIVFKRLLTGNGGNYVLVGIVRDSDSDRVYLIADKV